MQQVLADGPSNNGRFPRPEEEQRLEREAEQSTQQALEASEVRRQVMQEAAKGICRGQQAPEETVLEEAAQGAAMALGQLEA
eukprot:2048672-Lingulodinium_polyedra.AAC.1